MTKKSKKDSEILKKIGDKELYKGSRNQQQQQKNLKNMDAKNPQQNAGILKISRIMIMWDISLGCKNSTT